jgi:CDP-6-deoxy-D-xylo-4-hexulose-3-dehydrase
MTREYRLADQTIDADDLQDLIGWLGTNPWLTQGPLVRRFEAAWSEWLGVPHSTFVNSGSSANLLMYYALLVSGRLPNLKVVVPAVSWATTVAPAIQFGMEPIMCEADPVTFGLDPGHLGTILERERPGAVIVVHVLGVPADMDAIIRLKERFEFVLMEDCCAALGSRYDGQLVGTFGELSTMSFFYGHHLSTIEGGMVSTSDPVLHRILLQVRSHGWAKDLDPDEEAALARAHGPLEFNRPFTFYYPGFNVRSSDLNARIGLSQMRRVEAVVKRRIENHRVYQARFNAHPDFTCQSNDRAAISSISFAGLAASAEHRERVARALRAARIETRPLGGGNMSRQPYWRQRYPTQDLPVADGIHARSFQLPNHAGLTAADVERICDAALSEGARA